MYAYYRSLQLGLVSAAIFAVAFILPAPPVSAVVIGTFEICLFGLILRVWMSLGRRARRAIKAMRRRPQANREPEGIYTVILRDEGNPTPFALATIDRQQLKAIIMMLSRDQVIATLCQPELRQGRADVLEIEVIRQVALIRWRLEE